VDQLRHELLDGDHLRFDGTGIPVLDTDDPRQPLVRGQVIVFCTETIAVLHYTPTKEGKHIAAFLSTKVVVDGETILVPWEGTATCDAFSAHDRLFEGGTILEAGCNAHGLRKFRDEADKAPLLSEGRLCSTTVRPSLRPWPIGSRLGLKPTPRTCCPRTPSAKPYSTTATTGTRSCASSRIRTFRSTTI
jgi:hypothetical protein